MKKQQGKVKTTPNGAVDWVRPSHAATFFPKFTKPIEQRDTSMNIAVKSPVATDNVQAETPENIRPWGHYESLKVGPRFQVKCICVKPGGVLSLQSHVHRSEHWIVVEGVARVTIDKDVKLVHENESVYIKVGQIHRLENPGKVDMRLIEVQTGNYFGEDDIERYEDVYGRS